jgi:hypothetical protein
MRKRFAFKKNSELGVVGFLALRSLRQKDCEFEASLGYIMRSYLKTKQNKTKNKYILDKSQCRD